MRVQSWSSPEAALGAISTRHWCWRRNSYCNVPTYVRSSSVRVEGSRLECSPSGDLEHRLLPVRGVERGEWGSNLGVPFALASSLATAVRVHRRIRPELVVVTGGYAGAPAGLVAAGVGDAAGAPGAECLARHHDPLLVALGDADTPSVSRSSAETAPTCAEGSTGLRMSDPGSAGRGARPPRCSYRPGSRSTSEAPAVDRRKPRIPGPE